MTFFRRRQRPFWTSRLLQLIVFVLLVLKCSAFCPIPNEFRLTPRQRVGRLAATSSKDLKEFHKKRPPIKKKKRKKTSAVKRLARAAANAAALYPEETSTSPPSSTSGSSIGNLRQLTHVIDELLVRNQQNFSPHITLQPQDSMSSLLEFNEEYSPSSSCFHVAMVFCKPLKQDLVTCEYAARIRALVRLLMEEDSNVDVICFSGSTTGDNHVANADAGYVFFRHLCACHNVDLSDVNVYIDRTSKDVGTALNNVVKHLQAYYVQDWFQEQADASTDDGSEFALSKIHIHYSLISTGYHLCNLNDVHHRSPGQSLLRPVELQRMEYSSDDDEDEGIIETSWSYRYATYPYLYAKDDAVAFMARCYLLGEELMPLLINLKGVVQEREFFQRDNYLVLASIRRSLVSQMEELYKTKPTLRSDLRTPGRDVNVALEGVVLSLGRCIDLVRPAGLLVGSVSKMDFQKALRALEHAVSQIRAYCDPDAPLDPSEWGKLSATEANVTSHERLYTQLDDSLLEEEEEEAEENG